MSEKRVPPGNPDLRCFGPGCRTGKIRKFKGPSRYWKSVPPHFGYKGNDYFCSLQCGMRWAVFKCDAGDESNV